MLKGIIFFVFLSVFVVLSIMLGRTFLYQTKDHRKNEALNSIFPKVNFDAEHVVKHLAEAVRFKTISTEDDNKTNAKEFENFHAFLQKTYPNFFEKLSLKKMGAFGLLFKWKGQDETIKPILFMAHQDVVPIAEGTDHLWEHKPFSGDIDDEFVWGRGSLDDKGSLITIFESVELLLKEDFTPKRTIYFYFGDNEEIGGKTAIETAKYLKDQNIQFEYLIDEGGWISEDNIAYVSIVEKGYLDLVLSTKAKGGHSSMPPATTAIGELSAAISKLENNKFPKEFVETNQLTLDALMPELMFKERFIATNMWFFKPFLSSTSLSKYFMDAKLQTTTAPTIFHAGIKSNVLPTEANAIVNFRILPGETIETVIDRVKNVIDDSVILKVDKSWNPSPTSSTNTDGYQLISEVIHSIVSKETVVVPNLLVGATDGRHMASVSDNQYRFTCVHFAKDDFARFHGTNERLSKANIVQLKKFYYLLLRSQD